MGTRRHEEGGFVTEKPRERAVLAGVHLPQASSGGLGGPAILMQSRGSGLGATFGGGDASSFRTRRGVEQRLYQFTIVLAVLFVVVAMLIYIAE